MTETDNFLVLSTVVSEEPPIVEITTSEKVIEELFPILPTNTKQKLAKFLDDNYTAKTKYNVFAVAFNNYLSTTVVDLMRGGDPNSNFFAIPTQEISARKFWKACAITAQVLFVNPKNLTFTEFIQVVRKTITHDGFDVVAKLKDVTNA